jgi:hypothetical protein
LHVNGFAIGLIHSEAAPTAEESSARYTFAHAVNN